MSLLRGRPAADPNPPARRDDPTTWRPMAFGNREAKHIRNAVCEPLWAGRRAFAHVDRDAVTIRDENGLEVDGFDGLRVAIAGANLAIELVADGYLIPGTLRSNPTTAEVPGAESMVTPGQLTRQLFLGGGGSNKRKEALELAEARRVVLEPDGPTTFVAVDLLWLDGQHLLDVPLLERRRLMESALGESEFVRRSIAVRPPVEAWYAQWKALGIQEIAVKDANSRYRPGDMSEDWATAPIPRR